MEVTNNGLGTMCIVGMAGLVGLPLIFWGLYLIIVPSAFKPDSIMYKRIYYGWFSWRQDSKNKEPKLTKKQVRVYALIVILIGVFDIGCVTLAIVRSMM